jgi:RND family efflux transporter MFP subunit
MLGRLVARDVEVGDLVKEGVTIASIDPTALDLAVQAARADLSSAEAQYSNAAASEERQRLLLAAGNTSQAAYDSAKQAAKSSEANVNRAKAALAKAEEQLGYARLFSDFDGVVTAVGAEIGETVSAGQPVVTVARADSREAVVDIPDQIAVGLATGEAFDVMLQSLASIRAKGMVREVAPQSDASTRSRRVRLTLENPPPAFRLGSTVTAIRQDAAASAIVLPLSALLEKDGKELVWVVDPQALTVATRPIRPASKSAGNFTVADGLEAGTLVVTAGVHSLAEGQRVKLLGGPAE